MKVGIETERGPWVAALVAAGYVVFAINPMSTARDRERHSTSGAMSDAGDQHDAIAQRFCTATSAGALSCGCICTGS